jgi:hypothetical protein
MVRRSVRRGIGAAQRAARRACDAFDEAIEEVGGVVGARAGLGVALEGELTAGDGGSTPCSEPSKSESWVGSSSAGKVAGSTAKPWFWLEIRTRPVARSRTGWLAPWWPNFIL